MHITLSDFISAKSAESLDRQQMAAIYPQRKSAYAVRK